MSSIGFVFAGQGAQTPGMGKELIEKSPAAQQLFQQADQILGERLGHPLSWLCLEGSQEDLTPCAVCQPAIFLVSMAMHAAYEEKTAEAERSPLCCGGLSLGEFSAACVAGVFDFVTGLRLVAERGRLMDECCRRFPGGMAAVIGAEESLVQQVCAECGIDVANYNCPGQLVISGEKGKLAVAMEKLGPQAMKVVPLTVAGAYHSRLMQPAAEEFGKVLAQAELKMPCCRFVQNVTGQFSTTPEEIRHNLTLQVASSVRWESCARTMIGAGCQSFLEFGPGAVLCGLFRRIDRKVSAAKAW